MGGFWDQQDAKKVKEAKSTKGGVYLLPGNYIIHVQRCKMIEVNPTKKVKDDAFIAEFKIIESDNPKLSAGVEASYYVDMTDTEYPDLSLGNVCDFIRAGYSSLLIQNGEESPPIEDIEVSVQDCKEVTGTENTIAGVFLRVVAYNKPTKAGKDFTRVNWSVPENLDELVKKYAAA